MAVVMRLTLPEGVTADQYRAVNAALDLASNPPPGFIFHVGAEVGGRIEVTDVWESQGDFETFAQERLGAAIAETIGDAMSGPPDPTYYEVAGYTKL